MEKPTLISHFCNEEFLLPFWIQHHRPMFKHGIMIDYRSTDRSVEIIRELAPEWDIITTRNKYFDGPTIDTEVMDIESQISGWKVCLNTTEFILLPNLDEYLDEFERKFPGLGAVRTTAVYMVDPPSLENDDIDFNRYLVAQRFWGYFEDEQPSPMQWNPDSNFCVYPPRKSRLIHNKTHGAYQVGRHDTGHRAYKDPGLLLCWFNWSPYKYISKRKLQIFQNTSPGEQNNGLGKWLIDKEEEFHKQAQFHALRAVDLRTKKLYKDNLDYFLKVRGVI